MFSLWVNGPFDGGETLVLIGPEKRVEVTAGNATDGVAGWKAALEAAILETLGEENNPAALERHATSYTYSNGDMYVGAMEDGLRVDHGRCTYANGDVYEGDWLNDRRHGEGVFIGRDRVRYRGNWVDGELAVIGAD